MSLTFNKQLLKTVLFKMNIKSFDLYKHEAKDRDLNDYLLIRSLFTKITLNENCKRLCSCSLTRIKIRFIIYFIINENRSIISLSSRLIVAFDFFRDKRNDFEFKKNSSLELKSKSF